MPESLFDSKIKKDFLSVLVPEMMSSEDEEEDENGQRYFVLHKPNFNSKKFEKLIKIIDDAYMSKSLRRFLEQMRRREIGEPSELETWLSFVLEKC